MLGQHRRRWCSITATLAKRFLLAGHHIAAVAETGFSHRLTAYKLVGHFFALSYRKISGNNQVKNSFF